MTTFHFLPNVAERLTWFKDSPDPGDPACLCSWCGTVIGEGELPIRAWRSGDKSELRLHIECAKQTILELGAQKPASQYKDHTAFAEGKAAFLDGRRRGSNPYSGKSTFGPAWYAGWDAAWEESHAKRD
jgi:hypothetical protein